MENNEIIKLISNIIIIEEPRVDAHPGIAIVVVVFIINIVSNEITDAIISRNEITAILDIIISRKTAMAPKP